MYFLYKNNPNVVKEKVPAFITTDNMNPLMYALNIGLD